METPSSQHQMRDISQAVAGALAWWRDAGLTHGFGDTATPWLAPPAPAATPDAPGPRIEAPAATPMPPAGPSLADALAAAPDDLAAFADWWLSEPALAPATARRVAPRGSPAPDLMVIVPMPEADDEATLLSGPRGRALAAMLAAMGIAPERTYLATALPACDPLPDWADLGARGLGAILMHHIALVAPQRVCVFGQSILPLLQHGSTQTSADLAIVNQKRAANTAGLPPILGSPDLALLVERSAQRRRFWHDWLAWSA